MFPSHDILVALDTLKGEDGKEIGLDNNGVYIRWRYVGESWVNLITLSSLKGNDGAVKNEEQQKRIIERSQAV